MKWEERQLTVDTNLEQQLWAPFKRLLVERRKDRISIVRSLNLECLMTIVRAPLTLKN